jgi:type VI secretion system protein VasG
MTVIPFMTLGDGILQSIARMKLRKVGNRLREGHEIRFEVDDAVYAQMSSQCSQVDLGARQIDHVIDQQVLPVLSRRVLEQMAADEMPKVVTMGVNDAGEFTYNFSR